LPGDRQGDRLDRKRHVLLAKAQKPGDRDDIEGLEELGRLELADAELDPAPRPVDLDPDHRDEGQQDQEEAAPNSESLRACSRDSIDSPIITGRLITIQASWR
jgi:hypothetical protein